MKYKHLFSPIRIGNVLFRNRIFTAPMGGTDIGYDGSFGPRSLAFYESSAKGGTAAVTASELVVHSLTDGYPAFHLDLSKENTLPNAAYVADAIARHGAVPSIELSHGGAFAEPGRTLDGEPVCDHVWGPMDMVHEDGMKVKALDEEKIQEIVRAYASCASLAKRAGFRMIMIHGGHGWLIQQFLSPAFNQRTDRYGGSVEGRCTFAIEVCKAVREAVGEGFPIEFRMSGAEMIPGGYDIEEGCRIAKLLEPYIDLIHVSAGAFFSSFTYTEPSMFQKHGTHLELAEAIKRVVNIPVATIGALDDPEQMEQILAEGKADVIYAGRTIMADPFFPRKVEEGREDEIVHCLRCYNCLAERGLTKSRRCSVNPLAGRENEGYEIQQAEVKKRVLVVGGGPAGLYAAHTAARRGHRVILCDQSAEIGGVLVGEKAIPFKYAMYELAKTYERLCLKAGVEIRRNTKVTPEYVKRIGPDALILALGAKPIHPPIPGLDSEHVMDVTEYVTKGEQLQHEVAVLGGGLAGSELAICLGQKGHKVHLIEMREGVCLDANAKMRPVLLDKLAECVTVHTGCRVKEILEDRVLCEDGQGECVEIRAQSVVCALGQKPRMDEAEKMMGLAPFTRVIGDCGQVRSIMQAMYEGYHVGLDI